MRMAGGGLTAPLCHGTAGGCRASIMTGVRHTDDCPTMQVRVTHAHVWTHRPDKGLSDCPCGAQAAGVPFAQPTRRTMGQCTCQGGNMTHLRVHTSDCPALYPLQRQPGDERDALTRLTALCRKAWEIGRNDAGRISADDFEAQALDLISEARNSTADGAYWKDQHAAARADLAKAKDMVRTLYGQQSEARQQAFRDMAGELIDMTPDERYLHLCRILEVAKESES